MKSRLVNNIRNLFDPKRRGNILHVGSHFEVECINSINNTYVNDNFEIEDLLKLVKNDRNLIIKKIEEIRIELSVVNFEELIYKLGLNLNEFENNIEFDINFEPIAINNTTVHQSLMSF